MNPQVGAGDLPALQLTSRLHKCLLYLLLFYSKHLFDFWRKELLWKVDCIALYLTEVPSLLKSLFPSLRLQYPGISEAGDSNPTEILPYNITKSAILPTVICPSKGESKALPPAKECREMQGIISKEKPE